MLWVCYICYDDNILLLERKVVVCRIAVDTAPSSDMNRRKTNIGGFESLISTSKDLFNGRMSTVPNGIIVNVAKFKGKLGATIAVITSMIVGFLIIPNNILYFINNTYYNIGMKDRLGANSATRSTSEGRPDYEYAYIHAGIALITLGCLAMVVSIVLSYFASKSRRKIEESEASYKGSEATKTTGTVMACLIMMNIELFMSVITGCTELLYRPLITDAKRLHNMECAIAVFNIIIYIMYVVTMVLTSTVLKGGCDRIAIDLHRDPSDVVNMPLLTRDYISRGGNPYNSQSGFM